MRRIKVKLSVDINNIELLMNVKKEINNHQLLQEIIKEINDSLCLSHTPDGRVPHIMILKVSNVK